MYHSGDRMERIRSRRYLSDFLVFELNSNYNLSLGFGYMSAKQISKHLKSAVLY